MEDDVAALHSRRQRPLVRRVAHDKLDVQVLDGPQGTVDPLHPTDVDARGKALANDVRTDESRCSKDERFHRSVGLPERIVSPTPTRRAPAVSRTPLRAATAAIAASSSRTGDRAPH